MKSPLVSVIVPTFNRLPLIARCLDSIKAQTYEAIETIVVDDCSSDGTADWLREHDEYAFATVLARPQNAGASEARNYGVRQSHGDLIVFIDSDDILAAGHVRAAVNTFVAYPKVGLFCCDCQMIGRTGELLHEGRTWQQVQSHIKAYPVTSGIRALADVFLFSNSFPGFAVRREVFNEIGYLDQTIFPLDDYDFALRVAGSDYEVYYLHEPLAYYRCHDSNASGAYSTTVGVQKLRCLHSALRRNPDLRHLGNAVKRRIADVKLELAISHLYAGDVSETIRVIASAIWADPVQIRRLVKLGGVTVRNWVRR
jgi:glycosyltransferase involved in cell wall biosynthesis